MRRTPSVRVAILRATDDAARWFQVPANGQPKCVSTIGPPFGSSGTTRYVLHLRPEASLASASSACWACAVRIGAGVALGARKSRCRDASR